MGVPDPPALAAGGYVLLGGLVSREFGAPLRHQVAAAAALQVAAHTLAVGHLFETTTFDMLIIAGALWILIRALRAEPQRFLLVFREPTSRRAGQDQRGESLTQSDPLRDSRLYLIIALT